MKLTKQTIVTLIEEVLAESINFGGPAWSKGYAAGVRAAKALSMKGQTQSARGLRAYIEKATENQPDPSWRNGYEFAFKLRFSAQLTDGPTDGQLPYANARRAPARGFFGFKESTENVLQEEELQTVGEVLAIIQKFRQAQAGGQVGKKALEMAVEQIPGISNIWSVVKGAKEAKDMINTLYGMDDKFQSNTGLDKLNIDDNISKIVDDKVEAAFLNFLIDKLKNMNPGAPMLDATVEIQDFLASKFNQRTVKT